MIYIKHNINNPQLIELSLKVLSKGGLIVYPSDTVYGLLVDATSKSAVEKLITFKNRPPGKAISVFVSDFEMMKKYVNVSRSQERVLKELLPGPFTVILKSKHEICKELESEKGTLGVRIPSNNLIIQLIKFYKKPVTATSANLSGRPPHYSIDSLLKELSEEKKKLIDLVVDAGKLPRNKLSTIIDLTQSKIKTIRQGDLELKNRKTFVSSNPTQTKKISQFVLEKNLITDKPLFFIIEGELGVGKTVFVKGIAEYFGITNIISPSYVIYYEYLIESYRYLVHADLYNIEEENELDDLGLDKYMNNKNIICFEWGEKMGKLYKKLKAKGNTVYIKMKYISETKREIFINSF